MKFAEIMKHLKSVGTAQNVKVYKRHGAGVNVYGVSFAELTKLKKKIKTDQALAQQLWDTGNSDARCLAAMIADPEAFRARLADAWLRDISYPLLAEMLAGVVCSSPVALGRLKKWTHAKKELARACGYSLLSNMLKHDPDSLTEEQCEAYLDTIEKEIHRSPNRARQTMNMAVIAIGIYKPKLRDRAIAAGRRIGHVEVDHGQTSCKTPEIEAYILKAAKRHKAC